MGFDMAAPKIDFLEYPLPAVSEGWPNGWMSAQDLRILYNAARRANGHVLEVGPWLGRSTTALACGLRDRAAEGADPVYFDCIDFGITSMEEWQSRFNERLNPAKDKGRAIAAVYHPGGTLAVLIKNLMGNGLLDQMTNIIRGDFVTCPLNRKYGLIFCDAAHGEEETRRHMPDIARLAGPAATLVFDDVITDEHADVICEYVDAKSRILTRQIEAPNKRRGKLLLVETH